MAMADCIDSRFLVLNAPIYSLRVDIRPEIFLCDLPTSQDGGLVRGIESVNDPRCHIQRLMLFPRVLRKFNGGIMNDLEIYRKHPSLHVRSNKLRFREFEVLVLVRRLDRVTACIVLEDWSSWAVAEHAVASHFNVEDVLLAVFE
jgi:hypothetical protein